MFTFLNLGKKGNLGNQLFQIASTIGIAKLNNNQYAFPEWKYHKDFSINLPVCSVKDMYTPIGEKSFDFKPYIFSQSFNVDLNGWFQSELYFDIPFTKQFLIPKKTIIDQVALKYKNELTRSPILISIRRGDYVAHPKYYQLGFKYYLGALESNFPDWRNRQIIITSDELSWCQKYFGNFDNARFCWDLNPVEQLALSTLISDFVISNSTFSWWQAWMGEKEKSVIIRPLKLFRGSFAVNNNDKDFYPDRWIVFDFNNFSLPKHYYLKHYKNVLEDKMYSFFLSLNAIPVKLKKQIKKLF